MSRSYRKTPIFGHTNAKSEKDDKRIWHKRMRHTEHQKLNQIPISDYYKDVDDPEILSYLREVFSSKCCALCDVCGSLEGFDVGGAGHLTTLEKECSNTWDFAKDGKSYMRKQRILKYVNNAVSRRYKEGYTEERVLHRLFAK